MKTSSTSAPLSNAATHILLALAQGDLHGYGIMREVVAISGGGFKVGPGTLYDNLRTLLAQGVVSEFAEAVENGEPRRMYHLTELGVRVLDDELERLRMVVKTGRERLSAARAGGA
jgi:DNA-binding PadR family transcriptional regulator